MNIVVAGESQFTNGKLLICACISQKVLPKHYEFYRISILQVFMYNHVEHVHVSVSYMYTFVLRSPHT